MEAAEKRKMEEKERRMAQERERVERERVVRQKVAASTFARGYLSGIVSTVFERLQGAGFFYDPVERVVESSFMPWLKEQAMEYLAQGVIARNVVQRLVEDATSALAAQRDANAASCSSSSAAASSWAQAQAASGAAAEGLAAEVIAGRAIFVLKLLGPSEEEKISATRIELEATAESDATARYEASKVTS
jgi:hypothetical protein